MTVDGKEVLLSSSEAVSMVSGFDLGFYSIGTSR